MSVTVLGLRGNTKKYKINGFNLKKVSKFLCGSEDPCQTPANPSRSTPLLSQVFFVPHRQRCLISIIAFISVYLKYLFTCLLAFPGLELQGSTLLILSFTRMMNIYQIPFTMLGIQWLKKNQKRCSSHFYRTFSLMVHKSKQVLLI